MCFRQLNALPALLLASLLMSGCQALNLQWPSAFGQRGQSGDMTRFKPGHQQMIAENLVDALAQLPESQPLDTTIQLNAPDTPFGEMLAETLASAGYGLQYVEGDIGLNSLRYLVENAETETGYRTRYKIEVGQTSVERDYTLRDSRLLPTSGLRVSGSQANQVVLNDDMFVPAEEDSIDSSVIVQSNDIPVIRQISQPVEGLNNSVLRERTQVAAIRIRNENATENFFELNESKYASVFQQYNEIRREILVFPNDSLRMGDNNKAVVAEVAENFDPSSQIISVIGCSHGKTDIADGNRFLAIGRASRVREALVIAGVEGASIFDEGCWDGAHYDEVMPRRGVVLSVKQSHSSAS